MCIVYMIFAPLVYVSMFADTIGASAAAITFPQLPPASTSWWGPIADFLNIMIALLGYAVAGLTTFFQVMFIFPLFGGLWVLTLINSVMMGITVFLVLDFIHGLV